MKKLFVHNNCNNLSEKLSDIWVDKILVQKIIL